MKKTSGIFLVAAVWLGLAVLAWVYPARAESAAERRALAQKPRLQMARVLDGSFMAKFETSAQDQFPFREEFRALKAAVSYGVFRQGDNNGIYLSQGHAAKLEYPYNPASADRAVTLFQKVYQRYFGGGKAVIAVAPDKGYYLAGPGGYPAMDYEALFDKMKEQDWAEYVDLTDCLSRESYYRTDTHWRQETLFPAAEKLADALGVRLPAREDYREETLETPFYGVYRGQAAVSMEPDRIVMLKSSLLENCTVYNYETGKSGEIYDLSKLNSRDLYDVFLSGPVSLLEIKNPAGPEDRTLVVFRDSFGSSLVPLLAAGYGRVILVDLRYMTGSALENYVDVAGADVLFLYSTLVLNNSTLLRW